MFDKCDKRNVKIRMTEVLFRKLLAICKVTGKTKTGLIRDFINDEYSKSKKYEIQYYADLNKKV